VVLFSKKTPRSRWTPARGWVDTGGGIAEADWVTGLVRFAAEAPPGRAGRPVAELVSRLETRNRSTIAIDTTAGLARPRNRERNPDVRTNGCEEGCG
jgi:hypothetical protein